MNSIHFAAEEKNVTKCSVTNQPSSNSGLLECTSLNADDILAFQSRDFIFKSYYKQAGFQFLLFNNDSIHMPLHSVSLTHRPTSKPYVTRRGVCVCLSVVKVLEVILKGGRMYHERGWQQNLWPIKVEQGIICQIRGDLSSGVRYQQLLFAYWHLFLHF